CHATGKQIHRQSIQDNSLLCIEHFIRTLARLTFAQCGQHPPTLDFRNDQTPRKLPDKTPFRYSRKGFFVRWSELELVNEVKRQTDGISLEMRRVAVWPVTAHAVVRAECSAADHVCPEGIIRSEGRRAQSVLLVLQTVSTPVVEGSIGSLGVIETTVELPLFICLEGGV